MGGILKLVNPNVARHNYEHITEWHRIADQEGKFVVCMISVDQKGDAALAAPPQSNSQELAKLFERMAAQLRKIRPEDDSPALILPDA